MTNVRILSGPRSGRCGVLMATNDVAAMGMTQGVQFPDGLMLWYRPDEVEVDGAGPAGHQASDISAED
jgi:hypothetical protein